MRNRPPPSKVKTHDHRPRLDQEFDERFPFLRSVNYHAQNTVLTAVIRNKTKKTLQKGTQGRNFDKRKKNNRAPVGFRRSQAREVAGLHLPLMYL